MTKKCFQEFNSLKIKLRSCALSRKMRVRSSKRGCAGHIMDRELKLKWWKTSLWSQSTTLHYQRKWEAAFQEFNYANFEEEKDNARCSFGENWENSSSNVPVFIVYMRPYSGFTLLSGIYSPPIQGLCAKGKKMYFQKFRDTNMRIYKIGTQYVIYILYICKIAMELVENWRRNVQNQWRSFWFHYSQRALF